jgi:hypothetical protein
VADFKNWIAQQALLTSLCPGPHAILYEEVEKRFRWEVIQYITVFAENDFALNLETFFLELEPNVTNVIQRVEKMEIPTAKMTQHDGKELTFQCPFYMTTRLKNRSAEVQRGLDPHCATYEDYIQQKAEMISND